MSQDTKSSFPLQRLPDDLLTSIFLCLEGNELLDIQLCKKFRAITNSDINLIERRIYRLYMRMILVEVFSGRNHFMFNDVKDAMYLAIDDADQISSTILNNLELFQPVIDELKKKREEWHVDAKERTVSFHVHSAIFSKELLAIYIQLGLPVLAMDPFEFYFCNIFTASHNKIVRTVNHLDKHLDYVTFMRKNKLSRELRKKYITESLRNSGQVKSPSSDNLIAFPTGNADMDSFIVELEIEKQINLFMETMMPAKYLTVF